MMGSLSRVPLFVLAVGQQVPVRSARAALAVADAAMGRPVLVRRLPVRHPVGQRPVRACELVPELAEKLGEEAGE